MNLCTRLSGDSVVPLTGYFLQIEVISVYARVMINDMKCCKGEGQNYWNVFVSIIYKIIYIHIEKKINMKREILSQFFSY